MAAGAVESGPWGERGRRWEAEAEARGFRPGAAGAVEPGPAQLSVEAEWREGGGGYPF